MQRSTRERGAKARQSVTIQASICQHKERSSTMRWYRSLRKPSIHQLLVRCLYCLEHLQGLEATQSCPGITFHVSKTTTQSVCQRIPNSTFNIPDSAPIPHLQQPPSHTPLPLQAYYTAPYAPPRTHGSHSPPSQPSASAMPPVTACRSCRPDICWVSYSSPCR